MAPSPLLMDDIFKQEEEEDEETGADLSCEVSRASSGPIDDIDLDQFDPDGVDFEPLLVSGTGKILSYHAGSFHDYEGGGSSVHDGTTQSVTSNSHQGETSVTSGSHYSGSFVSVTSSLTTIIAANGNNKSIATPRRTRRKGDITSCLSNRYIQLTFLLLFAGCLLFGGLSRFTSNADIDYDRRIQTTVLKNNDREDKLDEDMGYQLGGAQNSYVNIMNVEESIPNASSSHVIFWEPFYGHQSASNLMGNSMNMMTECFNRENFKTKLKKNGRYEIQSTLSTRPLYLSRKISDQVQAPITVFTQNFKPAAQELFDESHRGVFVSIIHNPIDIYQQQEEVTTTSDNLLVRYLAGIENVERRVNSADFDVARQVLRSKFILGSCEDPVESLKRFVRMMDATSGSGLNDQCSTARQQWNAACRKMKEVGEQNRSQGNSDILSYIQSEHEFDTLLYEDSKAQFLEQKRLFDRDVI